MASIENVTKAGGLLRTALGVIDSGGYARPYVQQALAALTEAPPAPTPPSPVEGLPDVVQLTDGPFRGMYQHVPTGNIRATLDGPEGMRDYVARLAAQWTGSPPTWDAWAAKKQEQPVASQPTNDEQPL